MLYVRPLSDEETRRLTAIVNRTPEAGDEEIEIYRAKVILASAKGIGLTGIVFQQIVRLHPINVRKWIHRFNEGGIAALMSGRSPGRPPVFTKAKIRQIQKLAEQDPRKFGVQGLWSLHKMRRYLMENNIVDTISIETLRLFVYEAKINRQYWSKQ